MIDIENKVFSDVATLLRNKFEGISVYGEYIEAPSSFPCVTLVEDDNSTDTRFSTLTEIEEITSVMFTANVYSNKANAKKSEAKAIAEAVSDMMASLGFRRSLMNPIPNVDRTIYRITMRFSAKVRKKVVDGNNVYTIYTD